MIAIPFVLYWCIGSAGFMSNSKAQFESYIAQSMHHTVSIFSGPTCHAS